MKLTSKSGFTLAEVLITLGIIGVVAAMTMPTLMNQTNGAQFRTAYKKALSAISQAVTLNVALEEWNFADTPTTGGTGDQTIYSLLKKRMNVVREEKDTNITDYKVSFRSSSSALAGATDVGSGNYTLFFNDGIMFTFKKGDGACTDDSTVGTVKHCEGFVDVNGIKPPNKEVKCDSGSSDSCNVKNPTDVYPVVFYDQSILPKTDAAKAVLYSK